MYDYSNAARLAYNQIADKGKSVTLRINTAGTYNPANDTISGASNLDLSIKALITNYAKFAIDGTIIQLGDKQILVAGSNFRNLSTDEVIDGSDNVVEDGYQVVDGLEQVIPTINDVVVDDGVQYKILNVEEIAPGGTVVLYKIQARR